MLLRKRVEKYLKDKHLTAQELFKKATDAQRDRDFALYQTYGFVPFYVFQYLWNPNIGGEHV